MQHDSLRGALNLDDDFGNDLLKNQNQTIRTQVRTVIASEACLGQGL